MASTRMPLRHQSHRSEDNRMKASSDVRPASAQDTAACLAIYRAYVQNTAISWEGMARPVWAAIEMPGRLPMGDRDR
jgi:hypothetical protein